MDYSFDESSGSTGGFMDYGDGTWKGGYSWNPQYTETEFETQVNNAPISTCGLARLLLILNQQE